MFNINTNIIENFLGFIISVMRQMQLFIRKSFAYIVADSSCTRTLYNDRRTVIITISSTTFLDGVLV